MLFSRRICRLLFCIFVACRFVTLKAAFEVKAPNSEIVGVHGQPTLLGCWYTPNSGLNGLVITWQRVEDSQVVHSFYYGKDQLDRQSLQYYNRTRLLPTELVNGNASLALAQVRPEDAGRYLCSVSSLQGSDKVEVQLKFAAFYTEPRLTVQIHPTNISFQYESKGYPEPEVWWVDPEGQNLSHHIEVSPVEGDDGLFFLQTHLEVDHSHDVNYTFTLKNRLIYQVIERPVSFNTAGLGYCTYCPRDRLALLVPVSVAVLLAILLVISFWCHWKKS
ncbi:CD276 antigen-like isoform X1 [Anguilla rostrata]|uniref:CD276 antigen-like isoform X1 n=1 Tax=Anguilla rostrata TaxID=7938 RepID=UPI0030CBD671